MMSSTPRPRNKPI